jgi:hypothetical protein
MAAVGILGGFVRTTGDTMTGDLILAGGADLQAQDDATVSGTLTATYQGVTGDVMRLLATALSSGVTAGGDLSPNPGDPTKLDITATNGRIVDYNASGVVSATNPQLTLVFAAAQTALTPVVGVPTGVTWWMLDSTGAVLQQVAAPSPEQYRTHIVLGATAQVGGTIVTAQSLPSIQAQPTNQLNDLMLALGNFRISGGVISPNGVNLNINLSAGRLFARAFSQIPDYQNPHHAELLAETPMQFRHVTGVVGTAGALTSTLDVANYDPNGAGVVTAVGGGTNTAQNFRVWAFGTESAGTQVLVQYGQSTYATLALAQAAIGAAQYVVNPTAAAAGVLLGWISVIRTATDLSNTAQAIFVPTAGKFSTP